MTTSATEMLQECGGLEQVLKDMGSVRSSQIAFSGQRQELIKKYPNYWVAFHEGRRVALGKSLDSVFKAADENSIPRGKMVIRYLDPVANTSERMQKIYAIEIGIPADNYGRRNRASPRPTK